MTDGKGLKKGGVLSINDRTFVASSSATQSAIFSSSIKYHSQSF